MENRRVRQMEKRKSKNGIASPATNLGGLAMTKYLCLAMAAGDTAAHAFLYLASQGTSSNR
jgi:hypothetical protein